MSISRRLRQIIRRDRWAPSGKCDRVRLRPFAEYVAIAKARALEEKTA